MGWGGSFHGIQGRKGDRFIRMRPVRIEQFRFGEITVDGQRYTDDLLLLGDRVRPRWWRKEGHLLQLTDLEEALHDKPEVLVVGTGAQRRMKIAPEVVAQARKAGIQLLEFDTRTACQTYNHLLGKRKVVAALHLTC